MFIKDIVTDLNRKSYLEKWKYDKEQEENWINVKDKLPEENTLCLITDGESPNIAAYNNGNFSEPWLITDLNFKIVTHWIEIPSPPIK
jgi:hypothetical protein